MNRKRTFFVIFIISFTLTGTLVAACGKRSLRTSSTEESNYFQVEFLSAAYGDFDDDGMEDDCEAYIQYSLSFKPKNLLNHDFELYLYLPSGNYFLVTGGLLVWTSNSVYTIRFVITNSAIENGWYSFELWTLLKNCGSQPVLASDSIEFDPTGGRPGGEPSLSAYIV
ncbi:MAG: hypothetical protein ACTSRU_04215 [Candidatus Hodarchaeales archaeon]